MSLTKSESLSDKRGILLDASYGFPREERFVSLRRSPGEQTDIVHDLEVLPYPFADEECLTILIRNSLAYVKPWLTIDIFNELWRIAKPQGQLVLSVPYAGSPLFFHDPLHCNGFTEMTFFYFVKGNSLWDVHKPKPWKITKGYPVWQATGMMEVVMVKDNE